MQAGLARIDITPVEPVWMDGMIRSHKSTGVHDRIFAKALVLSGDGHMSGACAIVSLDVCGLSIHDCLKIRTIAGQKTGIPVDNIIIAATHSHSGPATIGYFNPREDLYVDDLIRKTALAIERASAVMAPAAVGCGSGEERTISHYRRLLADDGHVVMNWEPWPAGRIIRPLGEIDPEVGILKIVAEGPSATPLGVLFNHAGHPNVMSGDNYLITPDYPGRAEALLEKEYGGTAMFVNGAQGTMDIDGLKDRDWEGIERIGRVLAAAVRQTWQSIVPRTDAHLRVKSCRYTVPARRISDQEKVWAVGILEKTGGAVQAVADGVGDDYKAKLFLRLARIQDQKIPLEQVCLAIDDAAFISFPGELFTEIGMRIKSESPFRHTYILGLANGSIGYVPTRKAIGEGGYESETRRSDDSAGDIVADQSLALLRNVHG